MQAALFSGVRYIDTSESYENTKAEKVLGEVIERTKMRKDLFLVSKNAGFRSSNLGNASQTLNTRLDASLERLRTDYLDAYYIHGIASTKEGDPAPAFKLLRDPSVRGAFEAAKKAGKIKFAGLSCHDARLPEIPRPRGRGRLDRSRHDQI